jgi:hypothetical protein
MSAVETVTTFDATPSLIRGLKTKFRGNNLAATNLTDIKELSDSINSLNISNHNEEDLHVYKTYNFDNKHSYDKRLKITSHRDSIIELTRMYTVCIITGKNKFN